MYKLRVVYKQDDRCLVKLRLLRAGHVRIIIPKEVDSVHRDSGINVFQICAALGHQCIELGTDVIHLEHLDVAGFNPFF